MKVILFLCLCLLSLLNCCYIDTAICLIKSDKLRDIIIESLTSIKEKKWTKAISTCILNYEEVKSIVLKCIFPEEEVIIQPTTPDTTEDICDEKCKDLVEYHEREECYKDCFFGH